MAKTLPKPTQTLYSEGDEFYGAITKAIRAAKTSIKVDIYIFDDSRIGRRIQKALIRAAKRGVSVTLIYDRIGSSATKSTFWEKLREAGAVVFGYRRIGKTTSDFPMPKYWLRPPFFPSLYLFLKFWLRQLMLTILRRDHRKILLIDDNLAFVGGFNIMQENSKSVFGSNRWLDLMLMTDNKYIVSHLAGLFEDTLSRLKQPDRDFKRWRFKKEPEIIVCPRLYGEPSHVRKLHTARSYRIMTNRASKRLWITSPYFVPYASHLRALKRKIRSGVDVRIYLSIENDHPSLQALGFRIARKIIKWGGAVYLYHGRTSESSATRFSHAKLLLSDNLVLIGSPNFDRRSLMLNLESGAIIGQTDVYRQVRSLFKEMHDQSYLATVDDLDYPFWIGLLKPFVPLL